MTRHPPTNDELAHDERLTPLWINLQNRDRLSPRERGAIAGSIARFQSLKSGEDVVREGQEPGESCLMVSGYSVRTHTMRDGGVQISAVHMAGDFVDLHGFLLGRMDHSVMALGDCTVAYVPHAALKAITEEHPHLSRLLWLLTLVDAAIHRRWIAAKGRLSSVGQMAHFLCEIRTRLLAVGLSDGGRFQLPMTQQQLGDAMGLSPVHINRTLQEMRRRNLISWRALDVTILDWPELRRLGEFDPSYLNLTVRPR